MSECAPIWRSHPTVECDTTLLPVYLLRSRLRFASSKHPAIYTSWRGVSIVLDLRASHPRWGIAGAATIDEITTSWNTILERILLPEAVRVEALFRLRRTYSDGSHVMEGVCARGVPLVLHRIEDDEAREAALTAFADAQL